MPTHKKRLRTPRRAGAVLVLLTPEERQQCRASAQIAGLALGSWIRTTILNASRNRGTQTAP